MVFRMLMAKARAVAIKSAVELDKPLTFYKVGFYVQDAAVVQIEMLQNKFCQFK